MFRVIKTMKSTVTMKIGELRRAIRESIEEFMNENDVHERFGEKIGDQHAGPGVADEIDMCEVTPKGYEKVVKGLKKDKNVENPWAVANAMKKKGIKPKK